MTGISAHAAHPDLGDNAITKLIEYLISHLNKNLSKNELNFLAKLYELGLFDIHSPSFLANKKIQDESGILTSNIGFLDYKNGQLEIGINLRVPVNTSLEEIQTAYQALDKIFPAIEIKFTLKKPPLYIPKNSYLVQTLTNIFNNKTGQNLEPIAIGGATYARAFPNCIAFGANMPSQKDMCHQVNEFIDIDTLMLATKIYCEAIFQLAQ